MEDFSHNLRLLSSYYRSIAEVCRQLTLNRPQFNRYLAGKARPSANTMRRICDFFGVEEHEILLPHDQFRRLIQVRPVAVNSVSTTEAPMESEHLQRLQGFNSDDVDRYLGYYFEYYLSMACPGQILRTLVCIERQGDGIYYQRSERLRETPDSPMCHGKYVGLVSFLSDRIFLSDYESLTGNEMTQTILFPSFKNRITRLSGLRIGVSGSGERMPCCARVVYEYLGAEINFRKAFAMCGLFDPNSSEIDPVLREAVYNRMGTRDWHFRAAHL
ncbi:helix-turn-helix domain-containing protein [Oceanobacter kriegii]|uniref:helix-turn-helix domain-containing protein n=1 Tax=Oceanobacter kriegii TaxID=64972 RepID=UPI0003FB1F3A|nr:helix-turn-helix transcriptional regulator [Oceanobacter kriegii]